MLFIYISSSQKKEKKRQKIHNLTFFYKMELICIQTHGFRTNPTLFTFIDKNKFISIKKYLLIYSNLQTEKNSI